MADALAAAYAPIRAPRLQTQYEEDRVGEIIKNFQTRTTWRNVFAGQWEEIANLIAVASRNTFFYGSYDFPGQKKTDHQIDASGMIALHRFAAICDSLLTPRNALWHSLSANDDYLMKDRQTQLWFEKAARKLFRERYQSHANFAAENHSNFQGLGAFGTCGMFVDSFHGYPGQARVGGLRYRGVPLGELFISENFQGIIDSFVRWYRMTARQCMQRFPDTFPEILRTPLKEGSEFQYEFLHYVGPRTEGYDPDALDHRRLPFESCHISMSGRILLEEGGFNTFPLPVGRYVRAPREVYGRSPAMLVLPALKTLNAEKRVFLKAGHRAIDPVLLTNDDGLLDINLRPGAANKGGVNPDGKPLVHTLPVGNIDINEKMMMEEKQLINDAFLVSLFQILVESPTLTATEVMERANEKGILLAPTVGGLQSDYLGNLIPRELDVLMQQGKLDPMPPALREAGGNFEVVYTSPLSKMMRASNSAGFFRIVEQVGQVVQMTQDPSLFDVFDFETALPDIADQQSVPASYMSSAEKLKKKGQARQAAAQKEQQMQALPNLAAMKKADAAAYKAGMPPGGQRGQQQQPAQAA